MTCGHICEHAYLSNALTEALIPSGALVRCRLVRSPKTGSRGEQITHERSYSVALKQATLPGIPFAPCLMWGRKTIFRVSILTFLLFGAPSHCVHFRITTALEPDMSHKYYAPGIGMIKYF